MTLNSTALTDLAGTGAAPGAPYLDFGARLYSPGSASWLSVDPMAEKYYGIGPLTYCAGNPVNLVDPEGNIFDLFWDLANVVMDAASLMQDIKEKKLLESLIDGGGLVLDAAAAIVPFIPGGAGTAIKAARLGDKAIDAARAVDTAADAAVSSKKVENAIESVTDATKK